MISWINAQFKSLQITIQVFANNYVPLCFAGDK